MSEYLNSYYNCAYPLKTNYTNGFRGGSNYFCNNGFMYQDQDTTFTNIATSSPIQNNPKLMQNNSVSFGAKEEIENNQGMSKGAKWTIGLGLTALAGAGIYIATKGKIGKQAVKEVAEHIEFKPAKTVEEAKKFAQEKLGVTYYEDASKFNDVGMVNFINGWMVKIHNNPKLGSSSYPKLIYDTELNGSLMSMSTKNTIIDGVDYLGALGIDLKHFMDFEPQELKKYNFNFGFVKKGSDGRYFITDTKYDTEYSRRLVKNLNLNSLQFEDKMQLISDLQAYKNGNIVNGEQIRQTSIYNYLNHEEGHFLHSKKCSNYGQMKKVKEFIREGKEVSSITQEFIDNKEIQKTASKVSKYATESPLEFVAETFAGLCDGVKFDDDVMALYKKYNGPQI